MSVNLMEWLGKEFDGDVVDELSGMLGEPESKVKKAVGGLGPVLVAALADKASSDQGLADLFDMFKSGGFDGSQDLNLGSLVGSKGGSGFSDVISSGAPLIVSLLGDRRGGVTEWLASMAGIEPKSAAALLSLAAPALLNLIGGQAQKSGGLDQAALGQLLGSQGEFLADKVPDGLASALGITDLATLGIDSSAVASQLKAGPSLVMPQRQEESPRVEPQLKAGPSLVMPERKEGPSLVTPERKEGPSLVRPAPKAESGAKWWLWLIIALVIIALVVWWLSSRGPV